jgi:hypothetical protein
MKRLDNLREKYPAFFYIYKSVYRYRYYFLPILNILVPQLGHTPCVAGLPFFMVMDLALLMSFLARHFTQYACMYVSSFLEAICIKQ